MFIDVPRTSGKNAYFHLITRHGVQFGNPMVIKVCCRKHVAFYCGYLVNTDENGWFVSLIDRHIANTGRKAFIATNGRQRVSISQDLRMLGNGKLNVWTHESELNRINTDQHPRVVNIDYREMDVQIRILHSVIVTRRRSLIGLVARDVLEHTEKEEFTLEMPLEDGHEFRLIPELTVREDERSWIDLVMDDLEIRIPIYRTIHMGFEYYAWQMATFETVSDHVDSFT